MIRPSVNPRMRNEIRHNLRITGLLFENDIAMIVSQMKVLQSLKSYRRKRKIISDPSFYWRNSSIAYRFGDDDSSFSVFILSAN